ncbi:uncharacterized protein LOC113331264 [Papaver somniferum]|uniref:uncharacterized protein LOC113331264 n=1 Tax=Papaver somniferum TaxID=3469 RepID=UPI000E704485|nr:uncharacterized protein LOC113331264 [Papaver somniferum]
MDKLISPSQVAYVPKRLINDNIILAHELIHSMKRSKKKTPLVALKLDMSKAFDRLEWSFIDKMLLHLRFSDDWRTIIQQWHLINYSKSSAFICGDISQEEKLSITTRLGVKKLCSSDKYLGLPILLGKSKVSSFHSLKDSYNKRFSGWNSKTLNQAARTTMVKSVLNSIPAHYMSNFKMPKTTLQQLDTLQRNFWWGHKGNKGINFISWNSLCVSKEDGGLAFRNLEHYNLALLTKLAWRLCTKPGRQWSPRRWNSNLINAVFPENIANLILQMRLSQYGEDKLIWEPNSSGEFSVKSAYKAINNDSSLRSSQQSSFPKVVWKNLWKAKVPHKVKLFLWKCLRNIVPTLMQQSLSDKRVSCWFACHEIRNLIQNCLKDNQQIDQNSSERATQSWSPPKDNYLKINIDALFDHNTKEIGVGLIIRDSAGSAKGIRGRYFNGGVNPEQAECVAMIEAIQWAKELNLNNVLLESDCKNVVTAINNVISTVQWTNQSYVDGIRHILSSAMYFGVGYVKRSANNIAHVIAHEARSQKTSFDFGDDIPYKIEMLVRDEKKLL